MLITKGKFLAALILGVTVLLAGAAAVTHRTRTADQPSRTESELPPRIGGADQVIPEHPGPAAHLVAQGQLPGPAADRKPHGNVTLLRTPGHGIQPQAVVDDQGVVHLIYFSGEAGNGDIFYVRSEDRGGKFSHPLRVNSHPGSAIATGNIRGAHLALGKKGRVHVAWMGSGKSEPKGPGNATPFLYARLNDSGTAFEAQHNLIQTAVGLDGGGSVAADGAGNVYVTWHAPEPGKKGEENRRVWVAHSTDDGKSFAREKPASELTTGVCGCCGMRAFSDRKGTLYLLYRSAEGVVNRDTYVLISRDQGAGFQSDNLHKWKVGICPMSSFSLAESGTGILGAWETEGQIFSTRFDPLTGKASSPQPAPGEGKGRKHPVVAANARGETILVWTEGMGWNRGGAVAWQVFDKEGQPTAEKGRAPGVPTWSLVTVFPRPDGGFSIVY